ncbi:MAG: hypothetical protein COA47_16090 [Robiginitomaculum sp.]|nr:MAG: hypothetical protein COA47_16090 [Robiginitomaculum sp.]
MIVKHLKNLIAGIAMSASIGAPVFAQDSALPISLPASETPLQQIALLESNILNESRGVMVGDMHAGVLQISALLRRSRFEEQWAFVPAANSWIEIGHSEVASDSESEVELDVDYLAKIIETYGDVYIVHFHPASFYDNGRWADGMFGSNYDARDLQNDEVAMIGLALPSASDVAASVQLVELLGNAALRSKLRFLVISPLGQVEYGATDPGRARIIFNQGNPRINIMRELATASAIRRGQRNIARLIATLPQPTIGEVIAALCAEGSSDIYQLHYKAQPAG